MKKEYIYHSIFSDEIMTYLKLKKNQKRQINKAQYCLYTLDMFLESVHLSEKELTVQTIEGWLQSLPTALHTNTRIFYISHYSQFAKYLSTLGITAFIPERPIKNNLYVPYIFSDEEIKRMISAVDNYFDKTNKIGKKSIIQFAVILRILYSCGLRLNEVLSLRTEDIYLENAFIHIKNAKGNKERLVPVHHSLNEILKNYINRLKSSPEEILFENMKGQPRSQVWARYWFAKILRDAGIEKPELPKYSRNICIHCLRHSFAVSSFRRQHLEGKDLYNEIPLLSTYMGHGQIYETEKYLHMTTEIGEDILEQMELFNNGIFPEVSK